MGIRLLCVVLAVRVALVQLEQLSLDEVRGRSWSVGVTSRLLRVVSQATARALDWYNAALEPGGSLQLKQDAVELLENIGRQTRDYAPAPFYLGMIRQGQQHASPAPLRGPEAVWVLYGSRQFDGDAEGAASAYRKVGRRS